MYVCNECGDEFFPNSQYENSDGDQVIFTCPACGEEALEYAEEDSEEELDADA